DKQGSRQAVHHRTQHLVEIGFGTKLTPKFHQRFAIVVTRPIEKLVCPLLYPFTNRIEEQRGYHNGKYHSHWPRAWHARMDQLRDDGDQREVPAGNRRCRQGVNHSSLEDEL